MEIPDRPRELPLDGMAPCSVITQEQASQLAFDKAPRTGTSGDYFDAPMCTFEQSQDPFDVIDIVLVTTEGIGPWLSGKRNVDAWPVTVGGYPAVDFKLLGTETAECATSIDVAEGQQLMVSFMPLERADYRELCAKTEKMAGLALQTLQTLK